MLAHICLFWIGTQLNAPEWYYWLMGISFFLNVIGYGLKMFKRGKESR